MQGSPLNNGTSHETPNTGCLLAPLGNPLSLPLSCLRRVYIHTHVSLHRYSTAQPYQSPPQCIQLCRTAPPYTYVDRMSARLHMYMEARGDAAHFAQRGKRNSCHTHKSMSSLYQDVAPRLLPHGKTFGTIPERHSISYLYVHETACASTYLKGNPADQWQLLTSNSKLRVLAPFV